MRRSLVVVSAAVVFCLSMLSVGVGRADDPKADGVAALSSTPAELAIHNALHKKISVDFNGTPLVDVMSYLADVSGVQMLIDRKALADAGISLDTPISLSVKNLSLKSVLALTMEQADGMTWTIRNEVLQCTSKERANSQFTTRTYILREALGETLAKEYDGGKLAAMIRSHIAPDTWQVNGGSGEINAAGVKNPVLVVTQAAAVHEAIADLLAQLRATYVADPKPATPAPATPATETPPAK